MSQRHLTSRRTVLQTLCSLGAVVLTASPAAGRDEARVEGRSRPEPPADVPDGATQYVAVVDRIVDGEHVVLLLEDGGDLVDQHVAPRSAFEEVNETDVLLVVLKDDELLTYQHLPKRPGRSASENTCRHGPDRPER